MSVTQDRPGPYAPGSAILSLIHKHRTRGLPLPIDASVLERMSVSPSLIPRTLQALQTLDLVGEDGRPTDVFEGIRLAPEAEYQNRLTDWLADAYADALAFVDPATATETDIRDAFRKYVPTGQQDRMVSLFVALFTAAGVMPERAKASAIRKPPGVTTTPRTTRLIVRPPPKHREQSREHTNAMVSGQASLGELPPALAGLMASLPAIGQAWTKERREAFVATFGAVVDFCFPIREERLAPPGDDSLEAEETPMR